jgi:uncharacterized membrane protein
VFSRTLAASQAHSTAAAVLKKMHAPLLMLAFAAIGVADAFYDSYAIYTDQPLWCPPPIDECNIVASSPYAHILGIPVDYFGLVYYLYSSGSRRSSPSIPFARALRWSGVLYAAVGVSFSTYSMYVQFTLIHAFCIYCLISAVLTLLLLFSAISHFRATRSPAAVGCSRHVGRPPSLEFPAVWFEVQRLGRNSELNADKF